MYALAQRRDTNIGYDYGHLSLGISTSIRKAWNQVSVSVASDREKFLPVFDDHVSRKMIKAQELALSKIWGGAENDVWDDLYKELNAKL